MAIPPYPGLAGFPRQFDSTGRLIPLQPTADILNLSKAGEKIWNEAHAVDETLGGSAAYGTPAWEWQFTQNGRANSIGVPLPFPQMIGWDTFFPAYKSDSTKQDFAPGETPFDQCSQYFSDGNLAVGSFNLKWSSLGEGDYLPGTKLTKAQARDNVKIDTRLAAIAFGCTSLPFPEVAGKTLAPEGATYNPPPPPATLTDGAPSGDPNLTPTAVTEGPVNANGPVSGVVPTGSSDLPGPSSTVPAGSSTADRPNATPAGPTTVASPEASASGSSGATLASLMANPATWVLVAVALVVLTSKGKR